MNELLVMNFDILHVERTAVSVIAEKTIKEGYDI